MSTQVRLDDLDEPLLDPGIVASVLARKARGDTVGFETNATRLDQSTAEALIDAGLDWLGVHLDAARPETYQLVRTGGRFDRVTANVAGLLAARRRRGLSRPEVTLHFTPVPENVRELPEVVELAAKFGVDRVVVHDADGPVDAFAALATAQERADRLGVALRLRLLTRGAEA